VRIIAWVAWVVFVAIYLPLDEARGWDGILAMHQQADELSGRGVSKSTTDAYVHATFGYQLNESVRDPMYWLAIAAFGIVLPLIAYGLALAVARIARWVIGGFASAPL
jgi:hypothetical protein